MSRIWSPQQSLSKVESRSMARCSKRKLFPFLREHRLALLSEEFQEELWGMYSARERGKSRVHPAQLALATVMQAAFDVADHEVVELTLDSLRWRTVLDHWDDEKPAFSQGTLYNFRQRLIAHDMDRRLLERTVELAREKGGFSFSKLRVAFDASPLFGAGRVEDTFNLIGRAAWRVVQTAAEQLNRTPEEVAESAGITAVTHSSVKAALDRDWTRPEARTEAIRELVAQVESLGKWLRGELGDAVEQPPLGPQWQLIQDLIAQDLEPDPSGGGMRIRRGVARDRLVSVGDTEMRHGRKSKTSRFDGYKRHVALDLDCGVVVAVALTAGNLPERAATSDLLADISLQGDSPSVVFTDRGYLGAPELDALRAAGAQHLSKPFPVRNRSLFTKLDFNVDLDKHVVTCPAGHSKPVRLGKPVRFPARLCGGCVVRERCTRAKEGRGRSLSIHRDEGFHQELRARTASPEGRAELRERVRVEHSLAAVERTQGKRARYKGLRKNLFDLRRHAAVANLHAVERLAA